MNSSPIRVLVVDDEPFNLDLIQEYLSDSPWTLELCADGESAWSRIEADPGAWHAVLLDRMMPGIDGMEVLRRIHERPDLKQLPVILQTSCVAPEEIREGIQAGAYYYLTKPFDAGMLKSIVGAAVDDCAEHRQIEALARAQTRGLGCMHSGRFVIRTLSEGHDLAALLANACPEPQRTVLGLNELIINAIEHGSLEISYAEKGELVSQGRWHEEVERRLGLDAYRERTVEILFSRDSGTDSGRIDITIRDQGPGFDWREYLQLSPERGMDNHGRGVAMANMLSFDRIEYQGRGNIVVGSILRGVDRSE